MFTILLLKKVVFRLNQVRRQQNIETVISTPLTRESSLYHLLPKSTTKASSSCMKRSTRPRHYHHQCSATFNLIEMGNAIDLYSTVSRPCQFRAYFRKKFNSRISKNLDFSCCHLSQNIIPTKRMIKF